MGEAERQLRLLFEQARVYQPSIIFFDEIDGLTPVRSSKQDQIHSSIVSTLLALMDGLDSRGQVVVIGATNRVDAIDPALRRPGRFDREMVFDLPNLESRCEILKIHTKSWKPALNDSIIHQLAEQTSSYAGADLKALCTEAALCALHRKYPQIYESSLKLKIDVDSIKVEMDDFVMAMQRITPCSQRSNPHHAQPLPFYLQPLLESTFAQLRHRAEEVFPYLSSSREQLALVSTQPLCFSPRFLLYGASSLLVDSLSSAFLHSLDNCHITQFDVLNASRDVSITDTLIQSINEAYQNAPSILYLPHISDWLEVCPEVLPLLIKGLNSLLPTCPVFVFVTMIGTSADLDLLKPSFSFNSLELFPLEEESFDRKVLFSTLVPLLSRTVPIPSAPAPLPVLEVEEETTQPTLTDEELAVLKEKEEHYLRELRIFFREVLYELSRNPRYRCFVEPVKEEDVPDYYDIITDPKCLNDMFDTLDKKEYTSLERFMKDILLIQANAKEYNPNTTSGRKIVRAAAAMVDEVESMVHRFKKKLGYNLFKKCEEILDRRKEMKNVKPKPVVSPTKGRKVKSEEVQEIETTQINEADKKLAESFVKNFIKKWKGCDMDECIRAYEKVVQICMKLDSSHASVCDKIKVPLLKVKLHIGN